MKKITLSIFLMLSLVLWNGCSESVSDPIAEDSNGISSLLKMISSDEALSLDGFEDEDAMEESADVGDVLSKTSDFSIRDYRFGRKIDTMIVTRDVTLLSDDTALVTIQREIQGIFKVVYMDSLVDSLRLIKEKPFVMNTVRYALCVLNNPEDTTSWRLDRISMISGRTQSGTIDINSLEIKTADGSESVIFVDDPFAQRVVVYDSTRSTRVPTLPANRYFNIYADVESSEALLASVEYGQNRLFKARRPLTDNGLGVDETADDNVYSGLIRIRPRTGFHRAFIHIVPTSAIADPDTEFSEVFWGFPFKN